MLVDAKLIITLYMITAPQHKKKPNASNTNGFKTFVTSPERLFNEEMISSTPKNPLGSWAQLTRGNEIKNWVSIGLSKAKSRLPVRISSLNSSALAMKNVWIKLFTIHTVPKKIKNSFSCQPVPRPISGVKL